MPNKKFKRLKALVDGKIVYIDEKLEALDKMLDSMGAKLASEVLKKVIDSLDVKDGVILNTSQNLRKVNLIDEVYNSFVEKNVTKIVTKMVTDLTTITDKNQQYFEKLNDSPIQAGRIKSVVYERLGLNENGDLKRKGFMKSLLDDTSVKKRIVDTTLNSVANGSGYNETRKTLQTLIEGNKENMGQFKQFYRNAAYDTYAKVDALNGKLYADKLNLNYFIYAGTRRKASRHFCIKRKGKVFTREEALQWKNLIGTTTTDDEGKRIQAGPIVTKEDIDSYNPFIDRGGYGCVDDIMWISEEVAFALRPELKKA